MMLVYLFQHNLLDQLQHQLLQVYFIEILISLVTNFGASAPGIKRLTNKSVSAINCFKSILSLCCGIILSPKILTNCLIFIQIYQLYELSLSYL